MIIRLSDFIVFHEITNGPFIDKSDNIFAPWSPQEEDVAGIEKFIKKLLNDT